MLLTAYNLFHISNSLHPVSTSYEPTQNEKLGVEGDHRRILIETIVETLDVWIPLGSSILEILQMLADGGIKSNRNKQSKSHGSTTV